MTLINGGAAITRRQSQERDEDIFFKVREAIKDTMVRQRLWNSYSPWYRRKLSRARQYRSLIPVTYPLPCALPIVVVIYLSV